MTVINNVPSSLMDLESFNVPALYAYLVLTYSANTGSRKAALTQEIWETKNPVGQVRSAHGQLYATETKPDQMLAYALPNTLDESYAVVKQTLWGNDNLTSAMVLAQVQAEFNRRLAQTTSTALLAQGPNRGGFRGGHRGSNRGRPERPKPRDMTRWCDWHHIHGHNNDECH
jgi:hypothetical protein